VIIINPWKAAGPHTILGYTLRSCSSGLAKVLTDIFILSLAQVIVPSCFKTTTIVPTPPKEIPSELSYWLLSCCTHPYCDEMLIEDGHGTHSEDNPSNPWPLTVCFLLESVHWWHSRCCRTVLTHLEGRGTYGRILFIDYSSAFNTVVPQKLRNKLISLRLISFFCNWVSNFLTDWPKSIRVGNQTSGTRTISTSCPQGWVLSLLLYNLFTYDCVASQNNSHRANHWGIGDRL